MSPKLSAEDLNSFLYELELLEDDFAEKIKGPSVISEEPFIKKEISKKKSSGLIKNQQTLLSIKKEALRQNLIDLESLINKKNQLLLINLLTAKSSSLIENYYNYINTKIEIILKRKIPISIRKLHTQREPSIIESPGFYYFSEESWHNEALWVRPKIPYYFLQGTECSYIKQNAPEKSIYLLESAIHNYFKQKQKKFETEIQVATVLQSFKNLTFFELLRQKPFWYKALYDSLLNQSKNDTIL